MKIIPRTFVWQTILLILVPLIIAQVIMANVFFVTVLIMALNELVSDIIKSQN